MLNWWLILLIILIPLVLVGLGVYIVFYFQSSNDNTGDNAAKVVFVLGFVLAVGSILLIPFDMGNAPDPTVRHKYLQTLDTQLMWMVVLWVMAAMALVISPFFLFYSESKDTEECSVKKQLVHGVIMMLVILVVFVIITVACFFYGRVAQIPFEAYATQPQFISFKRDSSALFLNSTSTSKKIEVHVTFFTYCVGILCLVGWVFFFVYGGVGFFASPILGIKDFMGRTKRMSTFQFVKEMGVVLAKAEILLEIALKLQREARGSISNSMKKKINIVRNEVYLLANEQDQFIWTYTKAGGSPFIVFGKLCLHILSLCISLLWMLHIFIYNIFNADPFLNTMIIRLWDTFALWGIIAYAVLVLYLQWSMFQGQMLIGLHMFFLQIHPLRHQDTLVPSFLFNSSLQLIATYGVLAHTIFSFQDCAPYTTISGLLNLYVLNLTGIGVFIHWVQLVFVGFALLSAVLALVFYRKTPRDRLRELA